MSYGWDQYGDQAGAIADSYGLDRSVFYGLIDVESSWNPNASPGTSSAYGFTQLLAGTASGLGVNRFDPVQNLNGGAKYLSGLINKYGTVGGLAAYHDGPGAIGLHGGYDYAKKVLGKAQGYLDKGAKLLGLKSGNWESTALNAAVPGLGTVTDGLGITGGCDWFCQFKNWITDSSFFKRLGLAILAFIIIAAAFYLMNRTEINAAVKGAAIA